jgi:hypothetical protein
MDIGSAFTYVFDDEDWIKKVAIGGALALGSIILFPLFFIGLLLLLPLNGYMLQVVKNVRDGQTNPLPEWDDFGGYFKTGFFVAVIWFVYNLPALLFSCVGALTQNAPALMDMDSDMAGVVVTLALCLNCVQIILSLAAAILLPAGIIRFAQYDTLGSAFQFGQIFSFISGNIGDYIIVILLSLVVGIIAGFGLILCFIGVFFTFFWSMLVKGNLYGQLARKAQNAV